MSLDWSRIALIWCLDKCVDSLLACPSHPLTLTISHQHSAKNNEGGFRQSLGEWLLLVAVQGSVGCRNGASSPNHGIYRTMRNPKLTLHMMYVVVMVPPLFTNDRDRGFISSINDGVRVEMRAQHPSPAPLRPWHIASHWQSYFRLRRKHQNTPQSCS